MFRQRSLRRVDGGPGQQLPNDAAISNKLARVRPRSRCDAKPHQRLVLVRPRSVPCVPWLFALAPSPDERSWSASFERRNSRPRLGTFSNTRTMRHRNAPTIGTCSAAVGAFCAEPSSPTIATLRCARPSVCRVLWKRCARAGLIGSAPCRDPWPPRLGTCRQSGQQRPTRAS